MPVQRIWLPSLSPTFEARYVGCQAGTFPGHNCISASGPSLILTPVVDALLIGCTSQAFCLVINIRCRTSILIDCLAIRAFLRQGTKNKTRFSGSILEHRSERDAMVGGMTAAERATRPP